MINKLLEQARKNDIELEVVNNINEEVNISYFNNDIEKYQKSKISDYKLKTIYNNKTIKIETENIDNCENIINMIKVQSNIIDNNLKDDLAETKKISSNCEFEKPNFENIKNDLKNLCEFKNKYSSLVSITSDFAYNENTIKLYNTRKTVLEDNNNMMLLCYEIVMDFNGKNKTNYDYYYTKNYNTKENEKFVENLIIETIEKENSVSISTNKFNILLDSNCVSKILLHFESIYSAEAINKKTSILSNKYNEKVFSDKITIIEDPKNNDFIGKRLFDDEGTETKYKEIIKNGVFINKLYDKKSALLENKSSSGNSFGVRNMYIVPGQSTKEELLTKLNNGIYINDITGLHAGINSITGDISLQSEGYLVENGQKIKSLNMIILSSNIFELFNNVLDIGNDLTIKNIKGGAPSLLIHDVVIAGKVQR